jgi:hypothetical protein
MTIHSQAMLQPIRSQIVWRCCVSHAFDLGVQFKLGISFANEEGL